MDDKIASLRKFNLWGEAPFDFGYRRDGYSGKIADYVGNRLIKVLVGQRRSGKSYILGQIAKQLVDNGVCSKNTLFTNMELTDFDFLKNWKDLDELVKLYRKELNPSVRFISS